MLDAELSRAADRRPEPVNPHASLNVAAAVNICQYELNKRS
jgi:tRNA C32,U32 (ribose-2'-O)-methylase TrmJ